MDELVAAAGMWKYRCDSLKRDVMEQVKGMGDKMDWVGYYPEGALPRWTTWRFPITAQLHQERPGAVFGGNLSYLRYLRCPLFQNPNR